MKKKLDAEHVEDGAADELEGAVPEPKSKKKSKGKGKAAPTKTKTRELMTKQKTQLKEQSESLKSLQTKFDRWRARNPSNMLTKTYIEKPDMTEAELADMMKAWAVQTRDNGT